MNIRWKLTGGRDLHAQLECSCLDPKWKDTAVWHLMKTTITLSGYMDDYFFDMVNAAPRPINCPNCKRSFTQRWRRDGIVEIEGLNGDS